MGITRVGPRLTVSEQVQLGQARSKASHSLRGRFLSIEITEPSGRTRRAAEIFTDGRLNLNVPLLAIEGVKAAAYTPQGHATKIERLSGMTPEEIDCFAGEIDEVMALTASRAPEITSPEVVRIEAGTFPVAGSRLFGNKKPSADVITMSGFYACKYPVTVAEFREFAEDTSYLETIKGHQGVDELTALLADRSEDRHPVVFVNQADRRAYAQWRSGKTGENYYILTAAQQEYIRRGSSGREFPWGDDWDPRALNWDTNEASPVDAYPRGATPEGICDLAGNVQEATDSWHGDYDLAEVIDPKGPQTGKYIEDRGGSAGDDCEGYFDGAYRHFSLPDYRYGDVGFRLGRDL